jgi:lipoyl-dependent peroxiredoxin
MPLSSRADATWAGNLTAGSGKIGSGSSPAFKDLPLSWASRTEAHAGKTNPEELLAAAHASCYAMAFSNELDKVGHPPESVNVNATVTADRVDGRWTVTKSVLTVRGKVPGIDAAQFKEVAEAAKNGCPISRALQGNVELTVEATLE